MSKSDWRPVRVLINGVMVKTGVWSKSNSVFVKDGHYHKRRLKNLNAWAIDVRVVEAMQSQKVKTMRVIDSVTGLVYSLSMEEFDEKARDFHINSEGAQKYVRLPEWTKTAQANRSENQAKAERAIAQKEKEEEGEGHWTD